MQAREKKLYFYEAQLLVAQYTSDINFLSSILDQDEVCLENTVAVCYTPLAEAQKTTQQHYDNFVAARQRLKLEMIRVASQVCIQIETTSRTLADVTTTLELLETRIQRMQRQTRRAAFSKQLESCSEKRNSTENFQELLVQLTKLEQHAYVLRVALANATATTQLELTMSDIRSRVQLQTRTS